ncbi:MAG: hypothetical protein C4338_01110 [Rhodanobacteraceae bacterium]
MHQRKEWRCHEPFHITAKQEVAELLPQFLKTRIFDPLHMTHPLMHGYRRGPEVPERAYGYGQENGKWVGADRDTTSATRGDGGIQSNIDDPSK